MMVCARRPSRSSTITTAPFREGPLQARVRGASRRCCAAMDSWVSEGRTTMNAAQGRAARRPHWPGQKRQGSSTAKVTDGIAAMTLHGHPAIRSTWEGHSQWVDAGHQAFFLPEATGAFLPLRVVATRMPTHTSAMGTMLAGSVRGRVDRQRWR